MDCGQPFEQVAGRGRSRIRCVQCSPKQKKPAGFYKQPKGTHSKFKRQEIGCVHCGTLFWQTYPHNRFCSRQCGDDYGNARQSAARREYRSIVHEAHVVARRLYLRISEASKFTCEHCGKQTWRSVSGGNRKRGYSNRWCSNDCRKAANAEKRQPEYCKVHSSECANCKKVWLARKKGTSACSDECRAALKRADAIARIGRDLSPRPCKGCEQVFTPISGEYRRTFCSKACQRKYLRMQGSKHRHRATKYGVAYEPIDPRKVFERDGWRCQVCGKDTPKRRRGSLRSNAPELGHRIALSVGGPHTYANVQCECRACNSLKSNRMHVGQLPLFTVHPVKTLTPFQRQINQMRRLAIRMASDPSAFELKRNPRF